MGIREKLKNENFLSHPRLFFVKNIMTRYQIEKFKYILTRNAQK